MLLVIFGAGASFDSVPHLPPPRPSPSGQVVSNYGFPPAKPEISPFEQYRPPLANQLFGNREVLVHAMELFEDCMPLIPRLRKEGIAVEKELALIQSQAITFPRVHVELAAIRYYLHYSLYQCQNGWKDAHRGITNYAALLREIERWRYEFSEEVCFVTFNYDTMLEDAMGQVLGLELGDLSHFVRYREYVLIKLHGSINWGVELDEVPPPGVDYHYSIRKAQSLALSERYRLVEQYPMFRDTNCHVFPALAIPLEHKDEFVCPDEHVQILKNRLSKVTKIITIGWRATEDKFISNLAPVLARGPALMIVSGTADGAQETFRNLNARSDIAGSMLLDGGFTNLVHNLSSMEVFLRG